MGGNRAERIMYICGFASYVTIVQSFRRRGVARCVCILQSPLCILVTVSAKCWHYRSISYRCMSACSHDTHAVTLYWHRSLLYKPLSIAHQANQGAHFLKSGMTPAKFGSGPPKPGALTSSTGKLAWGVVHFCLFQVESRLHSVVCKISHTNSLRTLPLALHQWICWNSTF